MWANFMVLDIFIHTNFVVYRLLSGGRCWLSYASGKFTGYGESTVAMKTHGQSEIQNIWYQSSLWRLAQ